MGLGLGLELVGLGLEFRVGLELKLGLGLGVGLGKGKGKGPGRCVEMRWVGIVPSQDRRCLRCIRLEPQCSEGLPEAHDVDRVRTRRMLMELEYD